MQSSSSLNPMSFTENQHGNVVLEKLRQQRESGRFCDVDLVVQGRHFPAHRNILAACSPYFDSILKMHKVVKEQVTVNCLSAEVFELLLSYMYSGSVVIDRNNVMELLKLANNFLVTKLKNYCAEYLDRYLDAANCLTVKAAAEKYNMPGLVKNACLYLESNINRVLIESTDILNFPLRRIEAIFADVNYEISPEIQLRFILKWVSYNVAERETHFKQLLSHVSLARIDRALLSRFLDTDPLCEKSEPCRFALLQAMYENSIPLQIYETQYQSLLTKYSGEVNVYLNTTDSAGPPPAENSVEGRSQTDNSQDTHSPHSSQESAEENQPRITPDEYKPAASLNQVAVEPQNYLASDHQERGVFGGTSPSASGNSRHRIHLRPEPVPLVQQQVSFLPTVLTLNIKSEVLDPVLDAPEMQNASCLNTSNQSPSSGLLEGGSSANATNTTDSQNSFPAEQHVLNYKRMQENNVHCVEMDENGPGPQARPPLKLTLKLPAINRKAKLLGKQSRFYKKHFIGNNCIATRKPRGRPPKFRALPISPDYSMDEPHNSLQDLESISAEEVNKAEVMFKCPHCVYKSNCQSRIQAHIDKAHCRNRIFICNLCNYECKWNREYYMHMKQHFEGPPFRCDTCDYTAERIQMLLTHRMKHTDERPYKCTQCDYRCRTKTNLVAHLRSHTGEKPFSCPECGRGFAIKSTLDQHLATHSDIRPFRCDQCSFSTKYQSHLISHKRIHTGDVFHCQFTDCTYSSPKKSQLAAHLRTHLAVRAHSCKICGRAFIEKSHLVRHERIHLAEKPFKCEHCEYASSRRDKLKEHIQKHHSMQPGSRGPYRQRRYRRQKQLQLIAAAQAQAADGRSQLTPGNQSESGETSVANSLLGPAAGFRPITPAGNGTSGLDINTLLSPSPLLNRPSSAIFPSAGNHVMQPSPALSLNFSLDCLNDSSAPAVNKDVLLSTQVAPTPTLGLPASPQSTTNSLQSDPFPSSNTPTGELLQRPMSLPPLGGQPSNWSQLSDFSFTAMF